MVFHLIREFNSYKGMYTRPGTRLVDQQSIAESFLPMSVYLQKILVFVRYVDPRPRTQVIPSATMVISPQVNSNLYDRIIHLRVFNSVN
jgi:hypothetical protein